MKTSKPKLPQWIKNAEVPSDWILHYLNSHVIGILGQGLQRSYIVYPETSKSLNVVELKGRVQDVVSCINKFWNPEDHFEWTKAIIPLEEGWAAKLTKRSLEASFCK